MEKGTQLCIDKAIFEIASVRKMALEMENITPEEIDNYINSNLEELTKKLEAMEPYEFVMEVTRVKLEEKQRIMEYCEFEE